MILEDYCKNVLEDGFWEFEFTNGEFTLDGLLREPAYIFLEMVSISCFYIL
jgi:hypothetical protein